jgi:HK97 family phage portal protein
VALFRRRTQKRAWTAEPYVPPFPGVSAYGRSRPDTPESAMQIAAVWACVRLVADAISMMRIERFREAGDGTPILMPTGTLLDQPAAGRAFPEWVYEVVVSLLLRGNAYGKIIGRDPLDGAPSQIELQSPDAVTIRNAGDGSFAYYFGTKRMDPGEVWHLRGFAFPGSRVGLSPISYAAKTLSLAAGAEDFAEGFFSDGAHPSSVLTTDQVVDQDAARAIKDRFRAAVNGREPVVLGLGVTHQAIQVTPEESQFLATQEFSIAQIARFFGVPADMIGGPSGGSMTYANIEQRSLDFLTYCIQPWLTRIEASLSMLLPDDQRVRFDTSVLLRTDAETRAKVQAIQVASKLRTQTELRRSDGLAPLTEEQKAELDLVPLMVTPTGTVKATPALGASEELPTGSSETKGATVVNVLPSPPAEVRLEHHTHVDAAPAPAVNVTVTPAQVRLEQPITVQPADVRLALPAPAPTRRSIEYNSAGDIAAIVEEAA